MIEIRYGHLSAFLLTVVATIFAGMAVAAPLPSTLPSSFESEMRLAAVAEDRDSRVHHLKSALVLRPGDPQNVSIEFKIGILLGQTPDPEHNQPVRPLDALEIFKGIVEHYDYKSLYTDEPSNSPGDLQGLVPQAAIMAASIYDGYLHDHDNGKTYVKKAMDELQWIYETRRNHWQNAPKPSASKYGLSAGTLRYDVAEQNAWEKRRQDAAEGKVFQGVELDIVKAAVREYGYSFGPQHPDQVSIAMNQIIEKYPNTPMAQEAQGHINRAREIIAKEAAAKEKTKAPATSNQSDKTLASSISNQPKKIPQIVLILVAIIACAGAVIMALLVLRKRKLQG